MKLYFLMNPRKQKTLKVSAAMYGRPIVASLQPSYENKESSLMSEPPKQLAEENDRY